MQFFLSFIDKLSKYFLAGDPSFFVNLFTEYGNYAIILLIILFTEQIDI